jgi:DNA-binding response OmpR family regulator
MSHSILIVDDEPDIREVARMSLETVAGWHVLVAEDGRAAAKIANQERPDAVLLDVMMPEMDGPTTLALVRETCSAEDLPVLFLTAKVASFDEERLHDLQAQGAIGKPFDPMTLHTQIGSALGWS